MRKTIAIIIQVLIFITAWYFITNQIEANTWIFGFGDIETFKENTQWILLGAACLSIINLWVWWPKSPTHQVEAKAKEAKTEEAKAEDPIVPKMD